MNYAIQVKVYPLLLSSGGRHCSTVPMRFSSTLLAFSSCLWMHLTLCIIAYLLIVSFFTCICEQDKSEPHPTPGLCVCCPSPIPVPLTWALDLISEVLQNQWPSFPKLTHPLSQDAQALNCVCGSNSSKQSRALF